MRLVVALLCALAVLLLTWLYQQSLAPASLAAPSALPAASSFQYSLEVTATFDAGVDPFAENLDQATSLVVMHQGKVLHSVAQPIAAGETTRLALEVELTEGEHEFLVQIIPASPDLAVPRAVRVDLYRAEGLQPIASQVFWADASDSLVVGTIAFQIPAGAWQESS